MIYTVFLVLAAEVRQDSGNPSHNNDLMDI